LISTAYLHGTEYTFEATDAALEMIEEAVDSCPTRAITVKCVEGQTPWGSRRRTALSVGTANKLRDRSKRMSFPSPIGVGSGRVPDQ